MRAPVTPSASEQAALRLQKARTQILLDQPFFAAILLRRSLTETDRHPTLAVDVHGNRDSCGAEGWTNTFRKVGFVRACTAPITQISQNAGQDGAVIRSKVLEEKSVTFGYDARNDKYVDMIKEGIIDPAKVVRSALQNAASVSTLLLTSDALIAEVSKDDKKPAGGEDLY